MEKKTVRKPERLDDLPDGFIYYVNRDDKLFKNRSWKIYDCIKGIDILHAEIKVPDDEIICDFCNTLITEKKIPVIIQLTENPEIQFVKNALCYKCDEKYGKNYIHIGENK